MNFLLKSKLEKFKILKKTKNRLLQKIIFRRKIKLGDWGISPKIKMISYFRLLKTKVIFHF